MQIVIDIPNDIYNDIMAHNRERREGAKSAYYFEGLIQNSTPLPKGHGRLIDADALIELYEGYCGYGDIIDSLKGALTIVEADRKNCEHDKNKVFDKIRAEIEEVYNDRPRSYNHTQRRELFCKVIEIIDKYKEEVME
jgi:hypothetical protein